VPATPPDLDHLVERLAPLEVTALTPLSGGASSLTYQASVADGSRLVVKVAPPGLAPVHHRDVLRQARVMKALRNSAVPVPEVVWEDSGDPPEVPPLFVTTFVPGSSLEPFFDHDADDQDPPPVIALRMANAARSMAALHSLDPAALGLGDEPRIGFAAEVDRWCRLLETVAGELVAGWEGVATALRAVSPGIVPAAVVHGDFRLGNLLSAGPTVNAVIDWEIWTVGDPRVDVGWFLANADPLTYQRTTRYAGTLPSQSELAAVYADALGRELPALSVFVALACFKSAATWSLIIKHNRRRPAPDPELEAMAPMLPHLLERATALLD
jgi:aminoglycoside phosphotransferase (APT) family kinase protein